MVGSIRYDIREIREFLTNLIAHQDMIEIYGLNYFLRKQEESSINNIERHLESFQSDLYSAMWHQGLSIKLSLIA